MVAAFWAWFGLASGIDEGLDLIGVSIHTLMPGGILLLTVLVAWRWEAIGGSLLILEGLAGLAFVLWGFFLSAAAVRWQPATGWLMLSTLALPPLLAGALFVADWWVSQHPPDPRPRQA